MDGEDGAVTEEVFAGLGGQPQLFEISGFKTCLCSSFCEWVPTARSETEAEFLNGFFWEAPAFEVVQSSAREITLEEFLGKTIDDKKAFFFLLGCLLYRCCFFLLGFDVVLFGEPAQCFWEAIAFVFHEEFGRIAALSAAKTFKDITAGRNTEGRGFFVVERAKGDEVGIVAVEREETLDNFFDFCGLEDKADGRGRDHVFLLLFFYYDRVGGLIGNMRDLQYCKKTKYSIMLYV